MDKKKIKVITPEEALNKFLNWFDTNKRIAFLIAIFVGIITHITMITETIMSQDGLWNSMEYFRPGEWETSLGRWGIEIVQRLNQFIAIPTISTISCIVMMAITAVILIDIFELKSKISVIFTSAILVVTPTLTATVLYIYTSFAYCFSFFISALVIWFIYKFKNKKLGFIIATLCLVFSLSIYQSYIGVTIGLCIMISIIDLIRNKKELKEVLFNILKTALVVIIGGILYYIITQIILKISGIEISAYKNAQNVSILGILLGLKDTIIQTYRDFFTFFFRNEIVYNTNYRREVLYGIFFLLFTISTIISLVFLEEKDIKKKLMKITIITLLLLILPIGLNIIDIIIVGNEMYALTAVQMILIFPFIFAIFENNDKYILIKWGSILVCFVILATYYIADNTSYAALKLTYNQAYSTTMRIMDRMENTPGYSKDLPILFGGIVGNNNYPRTSTLYNYTIGSIVNNTTFHGSYGGAIGTWVKFIKVFYGLDIKTCTAEEYNTIVNSDIYKDEMEIFPAESSIKIMDGIIVVKLSDEPFLPY